MSNELQDFDNIKASKELKNRILDNINLNRNVNNKKRTIDRTYRKRKISYIPIIAIITLIIGGAVYGFSNLEYFRYYFGDSIYLIEDKAFTQEINSVEDEDYVINVEGVLTDDYRIAAVVSIKVVSDEAKDNIENIKDNIVMTKGKNDTRSYRYAIKEMAEYSTYDTKYFFINYSSTDSKIDKSVELNIGMNSLEIDIPSSSTFESKIIKIDQKKYMNSDYIPQKIIISQIGILVEGKENKVNHDIPNPKVTLILKDNSKMDIWTGTADDYELSGARFEEENKVIVQCDFEKVVDINKIKKVIVDGMEYRLE